MRKSTLVALVLLVAPGAALMAQEVVSPDSILVPGMRIRVVSPWAPNEQIVGTIAATKSDTLVVDTADVHAERRLFNPTPILVDAFRKVSVPVTKLNRVEISVGRSRWMGAARGAVIGALAVGTYVGLSAINGQANPSLKQVAGGFLSGAPFGAAFGAPVGWVYTSERWRAVSLQPRPEEMQNTFAGGN